MKYHNRKVKLDGMVFDSGKEAARWCDLKTMERAGVIKDLRRQVRFTLIPTQRVNNKVIERPLYYIADFTYTKDGEKVVEDVKGYRTKEYVIKRKILLYLYGIRIKEI